MAMNGEVEADESLPEPLERAVRKYKNSTDEERGQAIRSAREEVGVTRQALADHVGVQWRTLARWELEGTSYLNLVRAFRSVRGLRVNMDGQTRLRSNLSKASTVDLALELLNRARTMEARDAQVLELKNRLEAEGMERYLPPGL